VAFSLIVFQLQNNVWLMVKKHFILKYFSMGLEIKKGVPFLDGSKQHMSKKE
jgi:hypothetical protein